MALYIEAGFDMADIGTYSIDVVEAGSAVSFTASISSGDYFLRTAAPSATGDDSSSVTGYQSFISALSGQLNAGGTSGYSVTMSAADSRVTIVHDGSGGVTALTLTVNTLGGIIGHTTTLSGALSHEMDRTPDYWIAGAVGMWSGYTEREVEKDLSFNTISHSGKTTGLSRNITATELDLSVPLEPLAIVYTHHAATSDPWTWQALYRHCRNVEPLLIDDGTHQHIVRLREPAFAPTPISRDYVGHYDIPLRTYLAARITL